MMFLVMRTNRHQTKEAKPLYLRGIAIDNERYSIVQVLCLNMPAGLGREKGRMGGHHGADGL